MDRGARYVAAQEGEGIVNHRQLHLPDARDIDRDRRFRELNERILAAYLRIVAERGGQ